MLHHEKLVPLLISVGVGAYLPLLLAHDAPLLASDPVPACASVADDADGDGVGVTPHLFGEHACVVTEQTTPYPLQVAIDGQASRYTLVKNDWNPADDLANREIECTNYSWNDRSASFEIADVFTITHYPLAASSPYMGEFEITVSTNDELKVGSGLWGSIEGRYVSTVYSPESGKTLQLYADPWGEPIRFQNDQSGMRFWNMNLRDAEDSSVIVATDVQECRFTSGDTFEPTGHTSETPTQLPEIVVVIGSGPGLTPLVNVLQPEIINPQTGSPVPLRPLKWDLQDDLFQQQMHCTDYTWQSGAFNPVPKEPVEYLFMPPLQGENRGNLYVHRQQQEQGEPEMYDGVYDEVYEWWTEEGTLHTNSDFVAEGWYEITAAATDSTRIWHIDANPIAYTECTAADELVEQNTTPLGELTEPTELSEFTEQTETVTEELPERGTTDNAALSVSIENTAPTETTSAPTGTDSADANNADIHTENNTETVQPVNTKVTESVQVSGGGSLSLFMLALVAAGRRFKRGAVQNRS